MDFDTIKNTFSSYTKKNEQSRDKYGSMGNYQRILSKVRKVTSSMIPFIEHSGKGKTISAHSTLVVARVESKEAAGNMMFYTMISVVCT